MTDELLTAAQAAARLGVKRETLYAYVSRGLLERTVDPDGRSSRFDPRQVDSLRSRRRRSAEGEIGSIISSGITRVSADGPTYRGHPVVDLVAADTSFEAVAELLWHPPEGTPMLADVSAGASARHALPNVDGKDWSAPQGLTALVHDVQRTLNEDAGLLDRYRIAVALASSLDPLRHDLSPEAMAAAGRRMLSAFVAGLPKLHLGPRDRIADHLWMVLTAKPGSPGQRRALNAALVLLADHGLAASTLAARIAASVRSDPYSVVISGLGPIGGVLHGAASAEVHRLLEESAADGAEVAVGRRLTTGRMIAGIGHTVYTDHDPRHIALNDVIGGAWANDPRLGVVDATRDLVVQRLRQPVNIDFTLGTLTWLAGMEPEAGEMFALARTAGWIAHAIEEYGEQPREFR